MAEFKVNISDKDGKTYHTIIKKHYANAFIGRKIGDEIDGLFVGLPGYKLVICGGCDKQGFPMRKDIAGPGRKRILVSESVGYHPGVKGKRKKKSLRGNTISPDIYLINLKITQHGPGSISENLKKFEEEVNKDDKEKKT
ncbi:MAG TPA: 30S ribosomal protein S6e [Thermoplasmata archaeon]|nr:30S ribosomal protein S6e [Thermoplasmata archaeon]